MDVLTIMWGWIGGKKRGAAPPSVVISPAHISILDFQLLVPDLDDELVRQALIQDEALNTITVRDS